MQRRALLAGAATGVAAALAGCTGDLFGDSVRESREHRVDLPDGAAVSATNQNGDVDVEPHDGARVAVDAAVTVPSERRFEDVSVEASEDRGDLAISVAVDGSTSRVSVDLDVRVPDGTALTEVRTRNGDVAVRGVASVDAAETSNGDVTVRDAGPVSSAATTNGDVGADVPAPLPGDVELRTENGDVDAAVSPDVDAAVEATTQNGDVSVTGLDLRDADASATRVAGVLGDGGDDLTAATTNGDVGLRRLD
jgi:DUF4097 and DUF4098 domain-containing protein YvlB